MSDGRPVVDPVIEMQIDGEWVDITADCHQGDADAGGGFEITRGVPNEGNFAEPSQLNFTINNGASKVAATLGQSGIYSPMNPMGPYFGLLGQNQRVRLGLDRRTDDFQRTEVDGWGYIPDRTHVDGVTTVEGEQWYMYGLPGGFGMTPGAATIVGAATMRAAMFRKQYRDSDVRVRFSVDALTAEVGVIQRMGDFVVAPPSGVVLNDTTGWTSVNAVLAVDTSVSRGENTQSLRATVTGTPTSSGIVNVISSTTMWDTIRGIQGSYYARCWVRSSVGATVRLQVSWYDQNGSTFRGSNSADHVISANTWTSIDLTVSPPQDGYYFRFVVIYPSGTAPQDGWQLWMQDPELHDTTAANYTTAGIDATASPDNYKIRTYHAGDGWTNTTTGVTLTTGVDWWLRVQQSGNCTRIKAWLASEDQPTDWAYRAYDDRTLEDNPGRRTGDVGVYITGAGTTVTFKEIWVDQWRAHAEVSSLPPRFDLSRQIHWVPVQARGILRRLGQGRKALKSALSLHLEEYASSSYGWWPLEADDGDSAGNNIDGQLVGTISGITFGPPDSGSGITSLAGVSGIATLSEDTSILHFSVGVHANVTDNKESFLWFMRLGALPGSQITVVTLYSTGTVRTWRVEIHTNGQIQTTGYDRTGAVVTTHTVAGWNGNADLPTGCWIAFVLYLFQDGANVDWALNHHRPGSDTFWTSGGTYAGSPGVYTGIRFDSSSVHTAAGFYVTQVMHYAGDLPFVDYDFRMAARAYDQEGSAARFLRLGGNARVPVTTVGLSSIANVMGVQTPSRLVELFEQCAEADGGFIVEERDDFGLAMVTRNSMWNRDPLVLDIDAGHLTSPLEGDFDDQGTRNDVTVSRPGGSFRRSVQLTGPKNTNPPEDDPQGVGTYDEQVEINVGTDDLCGSHASFRVSRGTQVAPRYPTLTAQFHANAYTSDSELTVDAMGLDIGDCIALLNTEADYIPRRQLVQGYTEKIVDLYEWEFAWTTVPGDTRQAGVVNYSTRVGAADLVTDADFDAGTDTTLLVSSPGGYKLVRPDKGDHSLPLDIDVAGVRLRVTEVGTQLQANPSFESGTTGWAATSANVTIASDLWDPKRGSKCLRVTSLAAGNDGAVTDSGSRSPVMAANTYFVSGWIKPEVAATDFQIGVHWYDSGGVFLSTTLPGGITADALVWAWFSATVTSPASAAFAAVLCRNVFAGASRMWLDNVRMYAVSSYDGDPQTVVVEQVPVNANFGITGKVIPAGSRVEVVDAMRVGWGSSQ